MKTTFGLQQGATIYFSATPLHSIYLANVNINENGEESISVVTLQSSMQYVKLYIKLSKFFFFSFLVFLSAADAS